jgi:hypothetical protein
MKVREVEELRKSTQNTSKDSSNPDDILNHGAALYVLSRFKQKVCEVSLSWSLVPTY